jgi:hypothetical protein
MHDRTLYCKKCNITLAVFNKEKIPKILKIKECKHFKWTKDKKPTPYKYIRGTYQNEQHTYYLIAQPETPKDRRNPNMNPNTSLLAGAPFFESKGDVKCLILKS